MKKYILSIMFTMGMFYAGSSYAQNTIYCVLNGVGTHCPSVVRPATVPGMVPDQQVSNSMQDNGVTQYDMQGNTAAPYDMRNMQTGYNTSTPIVPAPTTVNGSGYGSNSRDVAAIRKAYSGVTATSTSGVNSSISRLYPNPVLATTRISLSVLTSSPVVVDVVDLNGNIIRTYDYAAGIYNLDVDMSGLPQGIYSVHVFGKDIPMENLKVVKQ